jgi:hypothetical protein
MPHSFSTLFPLRGRTDEEVRNNQMASFPLAADWDVCFALDSKESTRFLPQLAYQLWKVDISKSVQRALDNRCIERDYELRRHNKVWQYTSADGYVLAELLCDRQRRCELLATTPLVALMPEQFTLLIAPADDSAALRQMFEIAYECAQGKDEYCSAHPIVLIENEWLSFVVPPDLLPAQAKLRRHLDAMNFGAQKNVLEGHLQRQNSQDVMSTLMYVDDPVSHERLLVTFALYNAEGLALVPEADILGCVDAATREISFMRWSDVRAHASQCVERTEWCPPLWRLRELPDGPQLRKYAALDDLLLHRAPSQEDEDRLTL